MKKNFKKNLQKNKKIKLKKNRELAIKKNFVEHFGSLPKKTLLKKS